MSAVSSDPATAPRACLAHGRRSVAVVGGGPAGLMAADVVATAGHRVTVFERMPTVGRKFLLAGRGGLNLTHSELLERFISRYGSRTDALTPMIKAFPPSAVIAFAEALGQPVFTGSTGRIFPKALKASPLLRAWLRRLAGLGVDVRTNTPWRGFDPAGNLLVQPAGGGLEGHAFDAVVLALGGASWPRLGSDGAWVPVLEAMGVPVATLTAANAGVRIVWSKIFAQAFAGAPVKRIAVRCGGVSQRGEAVVTVDGLEGNALYALGPQIRQAVSRNEATYLAIDLRPDESMESLAARLSRPRAKQSASTYLRKAVNLAPVAIGLLREAAGGPLPSDPRALAAAIKTVSLRVAGLHAIGRAISTAGGVDFAGVNSGLMLKARPGVFVAGEMLDWEAPTGGYLLQGVLATGFMAGHGVLAWLGGVTTDHLASTEFS